MTTKSQTQTDKLFDLYSKMRFRPKPSLALRFKNLASSNNEPVTKYFPIHFSAYPIQTLQVAIIGRLKEIGLIDSHIRNVGIQFLSCDCMTYIDPNDIVKDFPSNSDFTAFFRHFDPESQLTTNIVFDIEYGPHMPLDIDNVIDEMRKFCSLSSLPNKPTLFLSNGEEYGELENRDFRVFISPEIHYRENNNGVNNEIVVRDEDIEVLVSNDENFRVTNRFLSEAESATNLYFGTLADVLSSEFNIHYSQKVELDTRVDEAGISEVYKLILTIGVVNGKLGNPTTVDTFTDTCKKILTRIRQYTLNYQSNYMRKIAEEKALRETILNDIAIFADRVKKGDVDDV